VKTTDETKSARDVRLLTALLLLLLLLLLLKPQTLLKETEMNSCINQRVVVAVFICLKEGI
jgi:hypothetical protein